MSADDRLYQRPAGTRKGGGQTPGRQTDLVSQAKTAVDEVKDTAEEIASDALRTVKAVTDKAKQDFDEVRHEAEDKFHELSDEAMKQAGKAAEKAKSFASEQKGFAAEQLGGVATAIGKVAEELDSGDDKSMIAGYARNLADGMERVSHALKNRSVDDLIGMAEDFGRRQPALYMGLAAVAGFAASRFLLASGERRRTGNGSDGSYAGLGSTAIGSGTMSSSGSMGGSSGSTPGSSGGSITGGGTNTNRGSKSRTHSQAKMRDDSNVPNQ